MTTGLRHSAGAPVFLKKGKKNMLTIGNHEYELQFTMPVWKKFEDEICLVDELDAVLNRRGRLEKIAHMVAIMSIDQPCAMEKIFRDMEPKDVRVIVQEIRQTISKALNMKVKKGEDEVVDEVLDEIEKKGTQEA